MPTPVEFMNQYRALRVPGVEHAASQAVCRPALFQVQLRTYFMMNWTDVPNQIDERNHYDLVTGGSPTARTAQRDTSAASLRQWFETNKENIRSAAMGKGAPRDYELALEWALRSGKIPSPTQITVQAFLDQHLGIDCSGFVTNYLCSLGRRAYSSTVVRNSGAASYYVPGQAVNDPSQVRQGDLLVWMNGTRVKTNPGHIAVVHAYSPMSRPGGNMHVVEATGNNRANPKLLDSWYEVESIFDRGSGNPRSEVMIFQVKRHGNSGERVCVIRP